MPVGFFACVSQVLSIVYAISLFLTIGLPIGLFSMNGSMKDFSSEVNYYLIQVVKIVMPIVLALSVISSIILWIAYLSSKNKLVAKIAAACTLSISVISFVVFWIYLNFYSVVGFGDAAFFLPIPFGVMILGIAWCVNVFKYQNEKPAYYANTSLNGQYVVSPQYPNQPTFLRENFRTYKGLGMPLRQIQEDPVQGNNM